MRFPTPPHCQQKLSLLKEYTSAVAIHAKHVGEYSRAAIIGGEALKCAKKQAEASRDTCQAARKRYGDHIDRHKC